MWPAHDTGSHTHSHVNKKGLEIKGVSPNCFMSLRLIHNAFMQMTNVLPSEITREPKSLPKLVF